MLCITQRSTPNECSWEVSTEQITDLKTVLSDKISPGSHNTKPSSFKEALIMSHSALMLIELCCYLVPINKVLAGDFSRMSVF